MDIKKKIEEFKGVVSEMGAYKLQLDAIKDDKALKDKVEAHIDELRYQSIRISLEVMSALSQGAELLIEHEGEYYQVYNVSVETVQNEQCAILKTYT